MVDLWVVDLRDALGSGTDDAIVAPRDARSRARAHRRHRVIRHTVTRTILGWHLAIDPWCVPLVRDACPHCGAPHGKPRVAGSDLRFNVSHSRQLLLVGVTRGREIGVDVEHLDPAHDPSTFAEACFTSTERVGLAQLPDDARCASAFRLWTLKEAYVKATGDGIDAMAGVAMSDVEREEWSLIALDPAPGFVGALAIEGPSDTAVRWRRPPVQVARRERQR